MATHLPDDRELRTALERLFSLQTFGIKLGLEPITALLHETGDPHRQFPTIHIAGTNGKGSVSAMIASVLQAAGMRVGLYTSPHLLRFNERIRVGGVPISDERLALYTREMLPVIENLQCTFFEGTTAMGFRYFAEENVDVAVIETGLGGRLDATNVLSPLVSAITSIGYDHTKHLGDTLEKIAAEKAGIIKPDAPAVIGPVAPYLKAVFEKAAADAGTSVRFVNDYISTVYHGMTPASITASFRIDGHELAEVVLDLAGRHQLENARVALGALAAVRERFGITDDAIRAGLGSTRTATGIRGRFEQVRTGPRVLIDVAHNEDGARVLIDTLHEALRQEAEGAIRFVYGAVEDKEVADIIRVLAPSAAALYAVRADNPRSLPAEEIYYHADRAGIPTTLAGTVADGINMALRDAAPADTIVVCGSFYVAADAIPALDTFERSLFNRQVVAERSYSYKVFYQHEEVDTALAKPRGRSKKGKGSKKQKTAAEELSTDELNRTLPDGTDEPALDVVDDPPLDHEERRSVKNWSPTDQPRERLINLGARALSDAELLAILLRTGKRGEDVVQVSRNILRRFGNIMRLVASDHKELQEVPGIGQAKAVTLAAAFEIGRRMRTAPFNSRPVISSPQDVARIYIPLLRGVQKEQFHVIVLSAAGQVIRMELISEGSLNLSVVHPREVFRTAIVERAASIVGLHNHPSGNPTPSQEDIHITRQLIAAGKIIGINFNDHIIIAGEEYVSMSERGLM